MKRLPAVRERTEELERASLSTWATLAVETKGRDTHEDPDPIRTAFQCDRDRILESSAFRALRHKRHLLLGPGLGTLRSAHAMAVAQIARTIGRGLRLNEDLIEAIALGQDLGATAFGPAGEDALSSVTGTAFRHEEQSLRVVEALEAGGRGLNLTFEVRDGILHHRPDAQAPATLEAATVRLAGLVVAVTHDLDEATAAGVVTAGDIPDHVGATLGATRQERVRVLVNDVVSQSLDRPELSLSPRLDHALHDLRDLLVRRLAASPSVVAELNRAVHCLGSIAVYRLQHPVAPDADPVTGVFDAVSALTDSGALEEFRRLFLPTA